MFKKIEELKKELAWFKGRKLNAKGKAYTNFVIGFAIVSMFMGLAYGGLHVIGYALQNQEPTFTQVEDGQIFEGLVVEEIIIEEGQSVWAIQSELYPNQDMQKMMSLLKEINGEETLYWVHPGDAVFFLRAQEGK